MIGSNPDLLSSQMTFSKQPIIHLVGRVDLHVVFVQNLETRTCPEAYRVMQEAWV